jgi:hypothetical protein
MNVPTRAMTVLFVIAFPCVLSAQPAGASLEGPCEASGTIDDETYNPRTQNDATIPREGTVDWQASVPGRGERDVEGKIYAKIGPTDVNIGSWGDSSTKHENSGQYDYDFPSVLSGLKVPVSGYHKEPGIECSGSMVVQLEGSTWTNPVLLGSIALTIVSVVNVALAVRAKPVPA